MCLCKPLNVAIARRGRPPRQNQMYTTRIFVKVDKVRVQYSS